MERIRPLLLMDFNSPVLSGGNKRVFEILRRAKSEGIDYVIFTDESSCRNAVRMFPSFMEVLSDFKVYIKNSKRSSLIDKAFPVLREMVTYRDILVSSFLVSRVADQENIDLIVGSEEVETLFTAYLAGKLSGKPWSAVFQPTTDLLQPSSIGYINPFNVVRFVSGKTSARGLSLLSRIGLASQLLIQLKIAERSLILSVSSSVSEELAQIDPRIRFYVIEPGNGISPGDFAKESDKDAYSRHDAIFFARLVPEKGLFDLPPIWKLVTRKFHNAVLAVAGIVEKRYFVDRFKNVIREAGLDRNIVFLGEMNENSLFEIVRSSRLTLYPSLVDSFSLVALESLACGTPVVAYDIPALRRNFGKCNAVLRCPVGSKEEMASGVLSILQNERLRDRLSRKAKDFSKNYDWRYVVRAEREAYLKVIKGRV